MSKRTPKVLTPEQMEEIRTKDFFDMILPGTVKFLSDHYIVGDSYRCVWVIREYPPSTEEQAILSQLADRNGVTLRIYHRLVEAMEQRKIIQNATRRNKMKSGGNDMNDTIEAEGNLQDVIELLANLRKNREPLLHCSVFIELKAKDMDSLKELQSEIAMELTRSKMSVDRLTLRQKEGFLSVLPVGFNQFGAQYERVLPASSVANFYPFNFSGKTDPHGLYIGRDKYGTNILVDFDRRAEDKTTSNILILGNSGQGKSYLLKLILTNLRESGKRIICLDPESEYHELCGELGGCYIDFMSGEYTINPLEPKVWADGVEDIDPTTPDAFKKVTRLSQHIAFLKDFFRSYKDFTDAQIDTIEILLSKLYARFGITDSTDYSKFKPTDYPIMEDFYKLCEEEFMTYDKQRRYLYTEQTLQEVCLGIHSMCVGSESVYFNGYSNITDDAFLVFGVKGLMDTNKRLKDAMLFNILSYMAKLITKFKYLKPNARQSVGGYAKYIATREGVDKIDQSYRLSPCSQRQQQLIEKILKDFPDSKEMLEYEDYLKEPTVGNASEFITRALEDNAYEVMQTKTYADYIATRPRAERFGSHGLFTDDGVPVKLGEVSEELNHYEGNVWTVIISLRREDAERLGFNQGERWREMLRTQTDALATNFKIPKEDLKWYAAFHNESHHPHVHLMVYTSGTHKPYLSKKGVMSLRSSLERDIFKHDLHEIYARQTEHRDELRTQGGQLIAEIVEQINSGVYDNPKVEEMLRELADRLYRTSGKKQYGYLKSDVKALVNRIVMELSADERIAALYDLWYEQREKVLGIYTQDLPKRIPLVDNPEFKSVKNAVISEAMNILAEITIVDENEEDIVLDTPEPAPEEIEQAEQESESAAPMSDRERISAMWRYYRQAKELLDRESEDYDPDTAVDLLIDSAKLGCDVAKYRLGKMFLRGEDVAKNTDYALRWLEDAVKDGNQYAEYLLGKTLLRGEDTEQDLPRAEDLLKRSSDKGNRYAKYALGKAYLEGLLLLQDIPEAIRLLTESADSGFAPAQYLMGKLMSQGEVIPKDLERAIDYLERAAGQGNPYAAYLAGKMLLTEEDIKDILRAIKNFEIAAENGNNYAEYQLGKLYLYEREVERDYEKAIAYLTSAAEHGNQYAEQLLHSIKNNKNWSATMGSIRLLHHLARMLQNQLEDERKEKLGGIDRKLKRKIDEKKQAHGLKQ